MKRDWTAFSPYPDLSLAERRNASNFDGNGQRAVRLWMWAHVERFQEEDYLELVRSEALDWVIMPLPGIV